MPTKTVRPPERGPSWLRSLGLQAYQPVWRIPGFHQAVRPLAKAVRRRWLVRDVQVLHDVLECTGLAGRYWMWSGLLLGWARQGKPLLHDYDADFALLSGDLPLLESAVGPLERAGFHLTDRYRNNAGSVTELTFFSDQTRCDFFLMVPEGESWRYFTYGMKDRPLQAESLLPAQPLVPFSFLERTWLKSADHERELAAVYGDWRTPDKNWSYLDDDLAIQSLETWAYPCSRVDGSR